MSHKLPMDIRVLITHISDDFNQVVCRAAGVADALHSGKQVRGRVTQQHTHLVGVTSGSLQKEIKVRG